MDALAAATASVQRKTWCCGEPGSANSCPRAACLVPVCASTFKQLIYFSDRRNDGCGAAIQMQEITKQFCSFWQVTAMRS